MENYQFETLQLHAGQNVDKETRSRAVPIYQTSSYLFDSSAHAEKLFNLEETGNIYTRIMNPTTDVLEKRVAALDGGVGALAVASGTAAILYAVLTLASSGDSVVSGSNIYGGTYNLFANTLTDYGIATTFVDLNDLDAVEKSITDSTKVLFFESIGNPNADIIDIKKVIDIAHKKGVVVVVDNTFATPYLFKPIEYGADIVVYSATKFLGGHGTSIAGVIVDSGQFDFKNSRYKNFNTPDKGYHNLVYSSLESAAFITKVRVKTLRDTGACLSPFNAFLILLGLETLSLRMERHVENARKIVAFLKNHPSVAWVSFPEIGDENQQSLAKQYFPKGVGSIFTFGIVGGKRAGRQFIDSVKLFSHVANVADAKSLVIHPASTTHGQLSIDQLKQCNISEETIRISVGLENIQDLIIDLDSALKCSQENL